MISQAHLITGVERHSPMAIFFIGIIVGFYLPLPEEKLFLSSIATIGALLSSLTGIAIGSFLSLKTDIAEALREKGFYKNLMVYGNRSVLLSLFLCLIAVAGFFIPPACQQLYTSILSGTFLSAFVAFYRVFYLLQKIGGLSWPPQKPTP